MNHYATNTIYDKGGRHYWMAKGLISEGYKPRVFCASTVHNSKEQYNTGRELYIQKNVDDIPYTIIKTKKTNGGIFSRIINMISFYINLKKSCKDFKKKNDLPEVIIASSVHPLTLLAGIQIGKVYNIPVVCEIRDLWPESLLAYGLLKKKSIILKALYVGEKYIYKKADALIFTWPGGKKYIQDKSWQNQIKLNKIFHIDNSVDADLFNRNKKLFKYYDKDLIDESIFKVIYTGSIRKVNDIEFLVRVANKFFEKDESQVKFLIYGEGNDFEYICKIIEELKLDNFILKGRVDKKYIPYILSRADLLLLHNKSSILNKYGQSQNKLFEYIASETPILQTYSSNFNPILEFNIGLVCEEQSEITVYNAIHSLYNNRKLMDSFKKNSKGVINHFDYKVMTSKTIKVLDYVKRI